MVQLESSTMDEYARQKQEQQRVRKGKNDRKFSGAQLAPSAPSIEILKRSASGEDKREYA